MWNSALCMCYHTLQIDVENEAAFPGSLTYLFWWLCISPHWQQNLGQGGRHLGSERKEGWGTALFGFKYNSNKGTQKTAIFLGFSQPLLTHSDCLQCQSRHWGRVGVWFGLPPAPGLALQSQRDGPAKRRRGDTYVRKLHTLIMQESVMYQWLLSWLPDK